MCTKWRTEKNMVNTPVLHLWRSCQRDTRQRALWCHFSEPLIPIPSRIGLALAATTARRFRARLNRLHPES